MTADLTLIVTGTGRVAVRLTLNLFTSALNVWSTSAGQCSNRDRSGGVVVNNLAGALECVTYGILLGALTCRYIVANRIGRVFCRTVIRQAAAIAIRSLTTETVATELTLTLTVLGTWLPVVNLADTLTARASTGAAAVGIENAR